MLKLVEIYEPVTTDEMVNHENEMFQEKLHNMSDEALTEYMNDLAEKGDYSNPYYMIVWDEYSRRGIKK